MITYLKNLFLFAFVSFSSLVTLVAVSLVPLVSEAQIKYELKSFIWPGSITDLIVAILNTLIVIAIPIIVLAIIYAGFLYVTARGNVAQVQKATTSLTYAIIGGVLIIGAVAISEVIANTVGAFRTK